MISIIVAIAQNYAIGKDNDLLWHLSDDLKHFKALTSGNTVVMGKRTFYSLPIRPLPKRRNIVISDVAGEQIEGCDMAYSIEEAVQLCRADEENFGGRILRADISGNRESRVDVAARSACGDKNSFGF